MKNSEVASPSSPSPVLLNQGSSGSARLTGEGEIQFVRRERVRIECEHCGADADRLHHFQLPNARRNPASAGYGRDDTSRAADRKMHACTACFPDGKRPQIAGYEWSGMYTDPERYPHLFLRWLETEAGAHISAAPDLLAALKLARECIAYCRRNHKDAQSGTGFPVEIIIDAAIAKAESA